MNSKRSEFSERSSISSLEMTCFFIDLPTCRNIVISFCDAGEGLRDAGFLLLWIGDPGAPSRDWGVCGGEASAFTLTVGTSDELVPLGRDFASSGAFSSGFASVAGVGTAAAVAAA